MSCWIKLKKREKEQQKKSKEDSIDNDFEGETPTLVNTYVINVSLPIWTNFDVYVNNQ